MTITTIHRFQTSGTVNLLYGRVGRGTIQLRTRFVRYQPITRRRSHRKPVFVWRWDDPRETA